MAGWFELGKSTDGRFRFVLKVGNSETNLTSELYTAKGAAEKALRRFKVVARAMNDLTARWQTMGSSTSISKPQTTRSSAPVKCTRVLWLATPGLPR